MPTTSLSATAKRAVVQRPQLPSEAYVSKALPHGVGSVDLIALLLLNVYWLTNVTPMTAEFD